MSFDQEFNLCMPLDMMAPENFNGAASTGTPSDDATGDAQTGWIIDGTWYPLQDNLTRASNAPQQEYNSDFTGYASQPLASSQVHLYSQLPGNYLIPRPDLVNPGSTGVSLSYRSNHLSLGTVQQSVPNAYEPPYFPAQGGNIGPASYDDWGVTPSYPQSGCYLVPYPDLASPGSTGVSSSHGNNNPPLNIIQQSAPNMYLPAPPEDGYYNANTTLSSVRLHPDPPLGEGTISGMSSAVVAPSEHLHRRAGKKGGKKGGAMTERVHDCAYDGKEEPLERGYLGYAKPSVIYQRLSRLKTEALDFTIFHEEEAHGVDPNNGDYICCVQASIVGGKWRRDKRVCNKRLQDKDSYRRHLEEQHFGLQRKVNGKHVPIETRIRRALEQLKEHERLKAEKEGKPTKKRKRVSDEDEYEGSSLSERENGTKKRRRAETF